MTPRDVHLLPLLALAALSGCGGSPPPVEAAPVVEAPSAERRAGPSLSVQTEVGALDEEGTQRAFKRVSKSLVRCFSTAQKRVPYLGGDIRLVVRVAVDGTARWVYVKDSTLGDRETEDCMVAKLKSSQWPKPVGGEGLAENVFTFEVDSDERPPVAWEPSEVSDALEETQQTLSACRTDTGTGPLKATLYVDTDGKPVSVGVSGSDEHGEEAAQCVVDALRGVTFPSPGSYDAKVSITIE